MEDYNMYTRRHLFFPSARIIQTHLGVGALDLCWCSVSVVHPVVDAGPLHELSLVLILYSDVKTRRRRRKAYRNVCGCVSNVNMSSAADANGDQEQNIKADEGCFVNHGCVVLEGDESTSTSVWVISRLFFFRQLGLIVVVSCVGATEREAPGECW